MKLNLRKPGLVTGVIAQEPKNNQGLVTTTIYSRDGSIHTEAPIKILGAGDRFVYAPPSMDSEAFIEYPDDLNRDVFVSLGLCSKLSIKDSTEAPNNGVKYEPDLEDVIIKNGGSSVVTSDKAGMILSASGSKNIKIQLEGGKLEIIKSNSADSVLVASSSMNYLATQALQLQSQNILLVGLLTELIATYPVTSSKAVFSALLTSIQAIYFNQPSANMVSSHISIPTE